MASQSDANESVLCARCLSELTPGRGQFFVVHIEAVPDPSPPSIPAPSTLEETRNEIQRLIAQASELTERELLEQVHRRMTIHLCNRCYREWIENPVG